MNATELGAPVSLNPVRCWFWLRTAELGRIATAVDNAFDIFPVNFVVVDETILFKTAPGSKLENLTANHAVAFEADGHDGDLWWSVVVHGRAERIPFDDEIEASGLLDSTSWMPGDKQNFVRIVPHEVTGIAFRRERAAHDS